MSIQTEYEKIKEESLREISGSRETGEVDLLKIKYLGRKGVLNTLLKRLGQLPPEERPLWGSRLNSLKKSIEALIREKSGSFSVSETEKNFFDLTLPVESYRYPGRHPVSIVLDDVIEIFTSMGFGTAYGPEVETDYFNFTALNFTEDHPARDMHDTFYVKESDMLLRTHTSPVQVRMMKQYSPPYKFIAPGKCYRRDTIDASHLPVFHQVEGLLVDSNISFAHLKGILDEFARRFFPGEIKTRFRPSFFPFTEPSAEMDICCTICHGKSCPSCSGKGWLEILGAGMVDPEVFRHSGVDPEKWQGFAFGMGAERLAMLKYGIDDMRLFFQNDEKFLEQF